MTNIKLTYLLYIFQVPFQKLLYPVSSPHMQEVFHQQFHQEDLQLPHLPRQGVVKEELPTQQGQPKYK